MQARAKDACSVNLQSKNSPVWMLYKVMASSFDAETQMDFIHGFLFPIFFATGMEK